MGIRYKTDVYENFLQGAQAGIKALWRIFPTILGIFIALSMVRNSLLWWYIIDKVGFILKPLGVSEELIPLIIMRPFSGSASLAVLTKILSEQGADSLTGLIASTFMASTETVVYVVMTYLASIQLKKSRHIFLVIILTQLIGIFCTIFLWSLLS
jgi:spore maturation protein B